MFYKAFAALLLVVVSVVFAAPLNADAPVDGRAGRAEVRFLEGMIDHHQMALDMAADCLEKASTEDVLALCQAVIDAQSAEIEMMQGWLLEWYGINYTPMSMMDMMDMMDMMPVSSQGGHGHGARPVITDPPMMMGMMAGLNRLEGLDYDIAWLEAMIDHHDDALHMAERILRLAQHEALRDLAQAIIADQTAEITLMESLIDELGG